jgi:hypothetical protein
MGKKERTLKKDTLLQALENSLGIVSTACNRTGIIDNLKKVYEKSCKI